MVLPHMVCSCFMQNVKEIAFHGRGITKDRLLYFYSNNYLQHYIHIPPLSKSNSNASTELYLAA